MKLSTSSLPASLWLEEEEPGRSLPMRSQSWPLQTVVTSPVQHGGAEAPGELPLPGPSSSLTVRSFLGMRRARPAAPA